MTRTSSELDAALESLSARARAWAEETRASRVALLRDLSDATLAAAPRWVELACRAKSIDPASPTAAEEWLAGPVCVLRFLRLLRAARPGPGSTVRVHPRGLRDRLLLPGYRVDVHRRAGAPADAPGPRVVAILGAGNVSSIGPLDALTKLFVEDSVCALKLHPVNASLRPALEAALAPLLERDLLVLLEGGADLGRDLVHHERVDAVHMTGSTAVHDAIVWGPPGPEQDANRRAGTPLLRKPITSELGCVTPVIVAPGAWSNRELEHQAEHVAAMVANNASFNCNAAKLLVTSAGWAQREEFLLRVEAALSAAPARRAYYPGSDERYARFLDAYPTAHALASREPGVVPWTIVRGLDPDADELAFREEAWCGVLAEVALEDAGSFLPAAARFCNERVWGSLSCCVLAPRATDRAALDAAVDELRYGTVGVNVWPAVGYALGAPPWGAAPGNLLDDVESGRGWVHDAARTGDPTKVVLRAPSVPWPKPIWLPTHRRALPAAKALAHHEHRGSLAALAAVAFHAARP